MDGAQTTVSIESLKVEERGYRRRVDNEPMDMCARMNLAWCLFVQAMHQAGRENVLAALDGDNAAADAPKVEGFRLDRDAQHLLRECLKQMCAVCELSRDPGDLADVERLRYLVVISGAEIALREADDEAARWLAEMAQAVITTPAVERPHRRRRVQRGLQ